MGISQRRTLAQRITSWLALDSDRVVPVDSRLYSWARRVDSLKDLPEFYLPFFKSLPSDQQQPLPYMVLTPTFRGIGKLSEPEKLVCLVDDAMHVVEQREGRLTSSRFPLRGHCRVERAAVLLHSWITVHASGGDGAAHSRTLRFNTVTDHLMAPFIDALRAAPPAAAAADPDSERRCFDFLAQSHYKFFSHGRHSIRPGDRVLEVLFQSQLRGERLRLFGYSISKRISPAHLTILTQSELITIRNDDTQRWIQDSAPGATWNYVPRQLIVGASLSPGPIGCITLSVQTAAGPPLQSILSNSAHRELERLVGALLQSRQAF